MQRDGGMGQGAILGCDVNGLETLRPVRRSDPKHYSLTLSDRQVADFGAIVVTVVRPMIEVKSDLSLGSASGCLFMANQSSRKLSRYQPDQQGNDRRTRSVPMVDVDLKECVLYRKI